MSALAQYSANLPSAMRRVSAPVKIASQPTGSGDVPGEPPRSVISQWNAAHDRDYHFADTMQLYEKPNA